MFSSKVTLDDLIDTLQQKAYGLEPVSNCYLMQKALSWWGPGGSLS